MWRRILPLVLAVALPACAGPVAQLPDVSVVEIEAERKRQVAFDFDRYMEGLDRVKSVGFIVLTANADACGNATTSTFGFEAASLEDIKKTWHQAAANKLGLSSPIGIIQIVKSGPAYRAGLRRGDHIVELNSTPVPSGRGATEKFYRMMHHDRSTTPVSFKIKRGGVTKTVSIRPVRTCAYRVEIATAKSANAFTDGSRIVVHQGLLKLARKDAELALVIGHELAHITAGHLSRKMQNQIAGMVGGLGVDALFAVAGLNTGGTFTKAGAKAGTIKYSKEFEKEADYIGMYYLVNSGYPTGGVETFWRKMSEENPRAIQLAGTHPTTPERYMLIRHTHDEIRLKRRSGKKLVPNSIPET